MIIECVKVMVSYLHTVSLVVAEIVCFNYSFCNLDFKQYGNHVLLQKLKG